MLHRHCTAHLYRCVRTSYLALRPLASSYPLGMWYPSSCSSSSAGQGAREVHHRMYLPLRPWPQPPLVQAHANKQPTCALLLFTRGTASKPLQSQDPVAIPQDAHTSLRKPPTARLAPAHPAASCAPPPGGTPAPCTPGPAAPCRSASRPVGRAAGKQGGVWGVCWAGRVDRVGQRAGGIMVVQGTAQYEGGTAHVPQSYRTWNRYFSSSRASRSSSSFASSRFFRYSWRDTSLRRRTTADA